MKNRSLNLVLLSIIIALGANCQANAQNEQKQNKEKTQVADTVAVLKYAGASYNVWIGEILPNKTGKITVEILSNIETRITDLNTDVVMQFVYKTIKVKILTESGAMESETFSIKAGGISISGDGEGNLVAKVKHIVYLFNTDAAPNKITVYNDEGASVVFDGKTKLTIKE